MHVYVKSSFVLPRVSGVFSCMMDLHKYPLDKQICDIRMESCKYANSSYMYTYVDNFQNFGYFI